MTSPLELGNGIVVRAVERRDVPAVVALVAEVLAEFGITFGQGAETDTQLAELPESYTAHGGRFWVACDGDDLIGTCALFPLDDQRVELRKMFVSPRARGKRLGQRLLDEALAYARARGAKRVVLDTAEQMSRAIAFYEANGFVRDDSERRAARCHRGYARDL